MNMNHQPLKQRKHKRKLKNKAQKRSTNRLRALRSKRERRKMFKQLVEAHNIAGMEAAQPHSHSHPTEGKAGTSDKPAAAKAAPAKAAKPARASKKKTTKGAS